MLFLAIIFKKHDVAEKIFLLGMKKNKEEIKIT